MYASIMAAQFVHLAEHRDSNWRSTETSIATEVTGRRGGGAFAKHNPRWTLKVISLLTQRPMDASLNAKKIARDVQRICSMLSVYM